MADTQFDLQPTAVAPEPASQPVEAAPQPLAGVAKTSRPSRSRGMPARPAIVAGLNTAALAGAGLHATAGMPGLAAGGAIAAGTAVVAAVRPRRGRRPAGAARKTAVAAGRSRAAGAGGARRTGAAPGAGRTGGKPAAAKASSPSAGLAGKKTGNARKGSTPAKTGKVSLRKAPKPTGGGLSTSKKGKSGAPSGGGAPGRKGGLGRKNGAGRAGGTGGRKAGGRGGLFGGGRKASAGRAQGKPASPAQARRQAKAAAKQHRKAQRAAGQATATGRSGRIARVAKRAARHPLSTLGQAVKNTATRARVAQQRNAPARAAARKAWAKKVTIQAGRGTHRAVRNGLVAALRGTLTGLFRWSAAAGWARASEVWKRRRAWQHAKDRHQSQLAAIEQAKKDEDLMAIADAVREPRTTAPPVQPQATPVAATIGEPLMADSLFEASAEMAGAAAAYEPTNMTQVGNDFANLPEVFRNVAKAMQTRVDIARENLPLDQAIVEHLAAVAGLLDQAAVAAEEIGPAFQTIHEVDIRRIEQPRVNEDMWNPDRQND